MIELNRNHPMQAVHKKTGEVGPARQMDGTKMLHVGNEPADWTAYFDRYGQPKDDFCPWIVRNVAMAGVDWSLPLEAVHISGMTKRAHLSVPYDGKGFPWAEIEGDNTYWFAHDGDGGNSGWRIRNFKAGDEALELDDQAAVANTIPIDRALWERVEGLVRGMCDADRNWRPYLDEARAIVAMLPAIEVDGDLTLARETVAKWRIGYGEAIRKGEAFQEMVEAVLMGIKAARGRELEAGR